MRNKKTIKNTDSSIVYNKAVKANNGCSHCSSGKGCNRSRDNDKNSWKSNRKTQWK